MRARIWTAALGLVVIASWAARSVGQEPPPESEPSPELAWVFPAWDQGPSWAQVELPPPPALVQRYAGHGQGLFVRLCASCHGYDARGRGLLAPDLPRPPRDLVAEPIRTRDRPGPPSVQELYRTLSAGAPTYGMPSFGHLAPLELWSLAAYVRQLRRDSAAEPANPLPPRPAQVVRALGERVYAASCATCHGPSGAGDGPAAGALKDSRGVLCPPASFRDGPGAFRGGSRAEDVARAVTWGRPGTGMTPLTLEPAELWAVSAFVADLSAQGEAARRQAWDDFFRQRRAPFSQVRGIELGEPEQRWDPKALDPSRQAPDGRTGCTGCHEGIAAIASGPMDAALDAFAGGQRDRRCALCHEGQPGASDLASAHRGMIPNPGSLWVTSVGQGCGKCHSDRDALTSLHGIPLPESRGGALMQVTSRQSDPSGESGSNHAYRMQRALMAQESGKAWLLTASVGLAEGAPRYTDFALDDPDGPVPSAGSADYRRWMAAAEAAGHLTRLEATEGLPTFDEAFELTGSKPRAALVDYFRKECARCHLWGEGIAARGEHRSGGCSACHVLTAADGFSDGADPTMPTDQAGHVRSHQLVLAIPEEQCNHCHTRGSMTKHSDAHQVAGLGCADCHTSIDVHGDGNIYPSIPHQLEIRCEDCHGTASKAPWDLPVGFGTGHVEARARGTYAAGEEQHLKTSRGNARTQWVRRGDQVVVRSRYTGRDHVAPLLLAKAGQEQPIADSGCSARRTDLPGHERLSCATCHGSKSLSCIPCHVEYFSSEPSRDWLLSALDYDPATTRQRNVLTPGSVNTRPGMTGTTWGDAEIREHPSGRLVPHIPGCGVELLYVGEDGVESARSRFNPHTKSYPPPVAPTLSHELALEPRVCADCHADGPAGGPVTLPSRRW